MDPTAAISAFPLRCPRCAASCPRSLPACATCGHVAGRTPGGAPILLPDDAPGAEYYEARATADEYLRFHYPDRDELADLLGPETPVPPAAARFPLGVRRLWDAAPDGLALDLGCASGRMTLELSRDHRAAAGLDRSARLVDDAIAVATSGRARYEAKLEGSLTRAVDVAVDVPPPAGRVAFVVGDAHVPPFAPGAFATVLALNLLCRVADPARCLAAAARLVRPGGLLIVSSPYTWLDAFTPPDRWLGGVVRAGAPLGGAEGIRTGLGEGFTLEREERLLFYIPWHDRSGQVARAHAQRFRRRG